MIVVPSTESQLRERICRVGKSLFDRGYVHGTAGNISVRLDDGFLITPTDACLGTLDPAHLAKLDASGHHVSGDKASKAATLHRQIYRSASTYDAHVGCIIHSHSTHCVALSLHQPVPELLPPHTLVPELLPPLTPYFVMKLGHVPLIPYMRPGVSDAAWTVEQVIVRYGQAAVPIRAVMLARLGPNVWQRSPEAAMAALEELEETAKLWQMSLMDGRSLPRPLEDEYIDELRLHFSARW